MIGVNGLSVQARLMATNNRPSGFDYLRLVLALSVVFFHSYVTNDGDQAQIAIRHSMWRAPVDLILPMFFSLSGFLVAGSLQRCRTLISFLGLRILRIVPALAAEVTLSALVLGPLLTTDSLSDYFSSRVFYAYFLNILGDIHYHLPGLFARNPQPDIVNGQLWTIPFELVCYLALSALALLGLFTRRFLLLLGMAALYFLQAIKYDANDLGLHMGKTLVMMFLAGVLIYQYQDKIKWNLALFFLASIVTLFLLSIPNGERFAALPAAYMTVYLGLSNMPRNKILLSGDYSYGIFLYGYPLQQAFVSLFPQMKQLNLWVCVPATIAVAVLSWWLVEKPILSYKQRLKEAEQWFLEKFSGYKAGWNERHT